jgi:mRNA-degrading endonuclease toxin of MazEF toxin-antitoxin module
VAGRIARGEVRLYQFAAPDKRRPALVLTRDSAIAYLPTVTCQELMANLLVFISIRFYRLVI